MTTRRIGGAAAAAALAWAVALVPALPAAADISDTPGGGDSFGLQAVDVTVRGGPGDPISGGSVRVSVPPKCWWTQWNMENLSYYDIDPSDPDYMAQYFEETVKNTSITFVPSRLSHPSAAYLAAHEGPDWTWYTLSSAPGVNCADEGFTPSGGNGPPGWTTGGSNAIPIAYAAYQAGPPPPLVDLEDVVTEVWDQVAAQVEGPDLDRNPKAAALGEATLVNLPTWFWVRNVAGALADDGEIRLELSLPGTPLRAVLQAGTDGVQITSPAGARTCTVDEVRTQYAPGVPESSSCSFPFEQANRAGWQVTAQTTWTGSWSGTDRTGAVGGTLRSLTPSATTVVPVVESQAVVDEVD